MPNYQGVWSLSTQYQNRTGWPVRLGAAALIAGYFNSGATVDYFKISSNGNATDFGDLTVGRYFASGAGSKTRFICVSGDNTSSATNQTIDFTTYATTGEFTDFGDTNVAYSQGNNSPVSNNTRSCFTLAAAKGSATTYNNISYITNATTGNATDFGNTTTARTNVGGLSSTTRGCFGGGTNYNGSYIVTNIIDYITISSTGNASDFGDLTVSRNQLGGCSSATRGLFCGGGGNTTIDYITISSTGNALDFGDLPSGNYTNVAVATDTTAVITEGGSSANMSQVTIATTGNAIDWGDLTRSRNRACGGSNAAASVQ